jgi:hypothetical protein
MNVNGKMTKYLEKENWFSEMERYSLEFGFHKTIQGLVY